MKLNGINVYLYISIDLNILILFLESKKKLNKFIYFFIDNTCKGGIILSNEHPRMKFFIRNLENSQWRVREESAEALGEIGDKIAVNL